MSARPLAALTTLLFLSTSLALLATPAAVEAAPVCGKVSDALIIFDRSGSMSSSIGGKSKLTIARDAVTDLTNTFDGQIGFGLEIFPGTGSCGAGKLNVAPGPNSVKAIQSTLKATFPSGSTPLAASLDSARTFLQQSAKPGEPQYAILITDGMETCGGKELTSAQNLANSGVKIWVVGFGSGVDPTVLGQIAQIGGTGSYFQADNLTQLSAALKTIANQISCCGNGVLDQGEQCDKAILPGQPGACVTSCKDNDPCTQDKLLGKECSARCEFKKITWPAHNDGCCPVGGNANVDNDCPKVCGNGVLDVGERCDTGIPSGQPGACPVTCDDGDACTADKMIDSGCMAGCIHAQICKCGNGKADNGELCDPKVPHGQPHSCPVAADCDDGDPCTDDRIDGQGCQQKCVNEPSKPKLEGSDGCCPAGSSSAHDPDCPPPCGPDRTTGCVDVCAGVTCADGHYCEYGSCKPWPGSPGGNPGGTPGGNPGGTPGGTPGASPKVVGGCQLGGHAGGPPVALLLLLTLALALRRRRG
jgi:hypothetical protein